MSAIIGIMILGFSIFFGDERAAYIAAHDFCPDTFVTRVDGVSRFECDGVAYAVHCADGSCDVRESVELASLEQ